MKNYTITKEQIVQLSKINCVNKEHLNEWFPDVFEVELEAGKWYRNGLCLYCFTGAYDDEEYPTGYGFDVYRIFSEENLKSGWGYEGNIEATHQEVETALKNEAVKRYKEGDYLNCLFYHNDIKTDLKYCISFKDNSFWYGGACVMRNGTWATVMPTKTVKEAEELLNCKIV